MDLKLKVHVSNSIQDILDSGLKLEIDYVVFEINTRNELCVKEVSFRFNILYINVFFN